MTANERISKARGECRHPEWNDENDNHVHCEKCKIPWDFPMRSILYDSDPAAWLPEHYQWIEDEKGCAPLGLTLKQVFAINLHKVLGGRRLEYGKSCGSPTISPERLFEIIKATPLQKATALDRALKERDGS